MSSSAAPIGTTSSSICIADEGSLTVLASSTLRQTNAIPTPNTVVSLHVETSVSNNNNNRNQPTVITTVDSDGIFCAYQIGGLQQHQNSSEASNFKKETFPTFTKLTAMSPVLKSRPNATISVVAASLHRPSGFSFTSSTGGKKPLTASVLLSCGTVVHHTDVSSTTTRRAKILGRHPSMAQLSNLIFAASPTLPLVVVAQPKKRELFVFYVDAETLNVDTVESKNNSNEDDGAAMFLDESDQNNNNNNVSSNKKNQSSIRKKENKRDETSSSSDSDDSEDDENENDDIDLKLTTSKNINITSSSPYRLPIQVQSPIAISTITLHPTRPCLAIGGVRGEVAVIHDIFDSTTSSGPNNSRLQNRQQVFIDHWHHTPVSALCFGGGQDGSLLLSGASEGVLCLWNIGADYARTSIGLGSGINDVSKITAIRVASDEPSKCVVAIGDGEIQLASLDLAHRRLVARRDGLTIAYSSTSSSTRRLELESKKLLLAATSKYAESNGATIVSQPVSWLSGTSSSTSAVFLYKRTSGKIRLYDPFERRSLRSSVLTASVETINNPPTVGLQIAAASADGKRLACFESSKEKIMPPTLRFLVYDEGLSRFRQVQQANDPHPGENNLVAAFWIEENSQAILITISKQRIKIWKPLEKNNNNNNNNSSATLDVASLLNPATIATSHKNKNIASDDDKNFLMTCSQDVVLKYHPSLSFLLSSAHNNNNNSCGIHSASLSADKSILFLASDVVAAVDLNSLLSSNKVIHAAIAAASSSSSNFAIDITSASFSNAASVVVAYPDSISIFGIINNGSFACRSTLSLGLLNTNAKHNSNNNSTIGHILAISAPFAPSSEQNTTTTTIEQKRNNDYVVALVASEQKMTSNNNKIENNDDDNNVSARLVLIDVNSCKILGSAPWQAKYAPMSKRSLQLLSSITEASSSEQNTTSWRCTIGVATAIRGFRTLNVVLKAENEDETLSLQKNNKNNKAGDNEDDASARSGVIVAPVVQTASKEEAEHMQLKQQQQNQERISSFFKKIDQTTSSQGNNSSATFTSLATEKLLSILTGDQVEKGKAAARYGREVLTATTFFATPSMSDVTSSMFERLEE